MPEKSLVILNLKFKLVTGAKIIQEVTCGLNVPKLISFYSDIKLIFDCLELCRTAQAFIHRLKLLFESNHVTHTNVYSDLALEAANHDLN